VTVFALACGGNGAAPQDGTPEEGTPTEAPADVTPTVVTRTPIVMPTPVPCVEVEAEPATSTIPLAEVLPVGKIVFVSFRDEYEGRPNREIYVISADADGPVNLTRNSCADDEPDLSSDGSKIAWESDRDGNFEIYVMNADGSDVTQLTTDGGLAPRWSPDGQRIAYTRGGTIKVMNADGSASVVVLAGGAEEEGEDLCQSGGFPGGWSPDGSRIVYYAASVAGAVGHVCTVTVDGSDVEVVVSEPPVYNVEPVWSPDGKLIAFRSIREGNHDIFVVKLEDGSEQRLTEIDALDTEPDWSPDGEWIVFASNRDGVATDIYVMRADGSDVRRLTEDPAKDSYPGWSP
jgi:Tol biopolymer transport system component